MGRQVNVERLYLPAGGVVLPAFGNTIAPILSPGDKAFKAPGGIVLIPFQIDNSGCVLGPVR
jgi:hypothetical protein